MPRWNFHCLKDNKGKHQIGKWRNGLSKTAQANLDRAMEHLQSQPLTNWERPHASPLGHHIYVIRFRDENRTQWRLFGHIHDEHNCFVATLGGTERDGKYLPQNYHATCEQRRDESQGRFFSERTQSCLLGCSLCDSKASPPSASSPSQVAGPRVPARVHGRLH